MLSHSVCGTLLQQTWETNATDFKMCCLLCSRFHYTTSRLDFFLLVLFLVIPDRSSKQAWKWSVSPSGISSITSIPSEACGTAVRCRRRNPGGGPLDPPLPALAPRWPGQCPLAAGGEQGPRWARGASEPTPPAPAAILHGRRPRPLPTSGPPGPEDGKEMGQLLGRAAEPG